MNCAKCKKPMSSAEQAAYRDRCEDCWSGGRVWSAKIVSAFTIEELATAGYHEELPRGRGRHDRKAT